MISRQEKIAAAFIHEGDRNYLQFRDGPKQHGALGKTGLFGGKVKAGETAQQAAYREVVGEELSLIPPPEISDFEPVDSFTVKSPDRWLGVLRRKIKVVVFELSLAEDTKVEAREGTLVHLRGDNELQQVERGAFSPVAQEFFNRRNGDGARHN